MDTMQTAILIIFLVVALWGCKTEVKPKVEPPPEPDVSEAMRLSLERQCGECHRSDLETAVPEALAVFDVTRAVWDENITPENYAGMRMRYEGLDADERDLLEAYIKHRDARP